MSRVCHAPARMRWASGLIGPATGNFRYHSGSSSPDDFKYATPMSTMTQHDSLVADLEHIVGKDAVFARPADLLVYEYDGSVDGAVETAAPAAVALPTTPQQVAEIVLLAKRHGLPVVARGAGTGLSGGAVPQNGGIIVSSHPHEPRPRDRPRRPHRPRRTGRHQPGAVGGDAAPRLLLRARSVQPEGLHHRRQRCRELGWTALPQVRRDDQPHPGPGSGPPGWPHHLDRRASQPASPATT